VSREGAGEKKAKAPAAAGTPIWVWVVYAFGIVAAAIIAFSVLFTAGAVFLSNDVPVSTSFSAWAAILWGGVLLIAVVTWLVRRRQRR